MIAYLCGKAIFSDGQETIVLLPSGVAYQLHCRQLFAEQAEVSLYVSHIKKETSEELFAFPSLPEKKLFELLITVQGVGPKSAYNLLTNPGGDEVISAIIREDKKSLTKAPGVGPKAAARLIVDLKQKIAKFQMRAQPPLIGEALEACRELGFKEDKILPLAQKILLEQKVNRPEQLVQLVLKEL